jgi:hypothetical protein
MTSPTPLICRYHLPLKIVGNEWSGGREGVKCSVPDRGDRGLFLI